MTQQRLTVGVFRTVAEAQLVLERLAAEGVSASIATDHPPPDPLPDGPAHDASRDGAAAETISPTDNGALGAAAASAPQVRVEVAEADFVRAMRVLFPLPDVPAGPAPAGAGAVPPAPQFVSAPAHCTSCGRPVEPGAAVCWACGAVQALSPPPQRPAPLDLLDPFDWEVDFVPAAPPPRPSPAAPQPRPHPRELPPHPASLRLDPAAPAENSPSATAVSSASARADLTARAAEQAIRRAWWAAIIGLVLCPGVAHLYSLGVLFILGFWNQPLSPRARWMYAGALVVDGLALAGVGWLIAML